MHEPALVNANLPTDETRRFFAPLPVAVWIIALLAALIHMFPVWHAAAQTPAGYEFTGNVTVSPDYMQYRTWMRQSADSGVFVDNRFTAEPSTPYLPVVFYWGIGTLARTLGVLPEDVYSYSGALFAFLLALLVFLTARYFLPSGRGMWWVSLAILCGGGLGAHLKLLNQIGAVRESGMLGKVVGAVNGAPIFESYRSHYMFKVLFDTHFLLLCLATVGALLAFYFAILRFSAWRATLAAGLCAALTVLHVYEAFTFFAVFAMITFFCWRRGLHVRAAVLTTLACFSAMAICLAVLLTIYRSSGLPLPDWLPPEAPFASLVLAFPIAWFLIVAGFAAWWRASSIESCFLLGWGLGCALLSLSGPYYPYADRAPMTMQIPICIIAGAIYFARRERVSALGAALVIFVLGVAPAYEVRRLWKATDFNPRVPTTFLDAEHRATIELLKSKAKPNDVLLADDLDYRWLAPENPGKNYNGHFFLTVHFDKKSAKAEQFFAGSVKQREEFLRNEGVKFVYVAEKRGPQEFEQIPGLVVLQRARHGVLFEYQ